ncbi:MAG: PHP domain-containing protein [Eggerthellaceae bacterium]
MSGGKRMPRAWPRRRADETEEHRSMELITTHTHTCFTNHGEGTVEELVSAAVCAGVSTIAVTEHYPMTDAFDPRHYLAMPADRMDAYLAAIEEARAAHPEIEVIAGCELDWLGDDEDRDLAPEDFAPFGLVLGSVHFVDRWPFDDPAQRGRWDEVGPTASGRATSDMVRGGDVGRPLQVMSHPDLAKKFVLPQLRPAAAVRPGGWARASAGRMVEVNTSGSYYACKGDVPGSLRARRVLPRRRSLHRGHRRGTSPPTWRGTSKTRTGSCTQPVIER